MIGKYLIIENLSLLLYDSKRVTRESNKEVLQKGAGCQTI